MPFRWVAVPLVFAGIIPFAACSSKPATEGVAATKTQSIQGGIEDGPAHPYAVGICVGRRGDCRGFCSGTLILPNVVVTARHCVDETPDEIDCTAQTPPTFGAPSGGVNWITTNHDMFQASEGWHAIERVVRPAGNTICGHDIALLVLTDVIAESEAKPVIPGVQYPMGDRRYARSFAAIGFGNEAPTGASAGIRRIREKIDVLCIPGNEALPCPPSLPTGEFISDDGTCQGDSGSSALETTSFNSGRPVSFGVLSRGTESTDGKTCQLGAYTRLDRWRDFVVDAAAEASNNWTLYPKPIPDWTVYVPPPPAETETDAGTADARPRAKLEDGYACGDNAECQSNVCADTGAGKACTTTCDDAGACAEGMVCKDAICIYGTIDPAPTAPVTTATSGCSVGPHSKARVGGSFALMAALALAVRRRGNRRHEGR